MGTCSNCGNKYDATFRVEMRDECYEFDCFECAINMLAPKCSHCQTRIIGHGVQDGYDMYCSAHCARLEGRRELQDRATAFAP